MTETTKCVQKYCIYEYYTYNKYIIIALTYEWSLISSLVVLI